MTLERREQALLALVERERDAQCAKLRDDARGRAEALLREAREDARKRVRDAYAEERRRAQDTLHAAQARLATRRRLHEQRRTAALLALGWQRLPDALRARWRDAAARAAWVDAVVAAALAMLPRTAWRVAHGADWPDAERAGLVARLAPLLDAAPALREDPDIDAGLRISAGGNVVDGTRAGLTDDRRDVGAQLLRHLERTP